MRLGRETIDARVIRPTPVFPGLKRAKFGHKRHYRTLKCGAVSECGFVMKTKMTVYSPDADRSVTCALIHINSVEALQAN